MTSTLTRDDGWLLLKRGLYWRPNSSGYTGVKSEAGRYRFMEVEAWALHSRNEVTALHEDDAPDYSPGCALDIKCADLEKRLAKLALTPPPDVAGLVSELREQHSMQNGDMDSIIAYAEYSNRVRHKAADALLSLSARIRGLEGEKDKTRLETIEALSRALAKIAPLEFVALAEKAKAAVETEETGFEEFLSFLRGEPRRASTGART